MSHNTSHMRKPHLLKVTHQLTVGPKVRPTARALWRGRHFVPADLSQIPWVRSQRDSIVTGRGEKRLNSRFITLEWRGIQAAVPELSPQSPEVAAEGDCPC